MVDGLETGLVLVEVDVKSDIGGLDDFDVFVDQSNLDLFAGSDAVFEELVELLERSFSFVVKFYHRSFLINKIR